MRLRDSVFRVLVPAALAILAIASSSPLRAQSPANPLRAAPTLAPIVRRAPTPADPNTRPVSAIDGSTALWTEPSADIVPHAVPNEFGEPNKLTPEVNAYGLPADNDQWADDEHAWSQQLVHRWFAEPWFSHSDPNDPLRHVGLGQPLIGTSWRNRPLYAGAFMGGLFTNDLTSRVDQSDSSFLGLRLGGDFDHYWGVELRYAFAPPELTNSQGQTLNVGHARDYFADIELLYYPWGDARWRPYFLAGLGLQTVRFYDDQNKRVSESLFAIPVGLGLKYFCGPWFTLRFDFVDNIAIGNDHINGMHNLAIMAGAEYRFGGHRQSYYPWHNNTAYW